MGFEKVNETISSLIEDFQFSEKEIYDLLLNNDFVSNDKVIKNSIFNKVAITAKSIKCNLLSFKYSLMGTIFREDDSMLINTNTNLFKEKINGVYYFYNYKNRDAENINIEMTGFLFEKNNKKIFISSNEIITFYQDNTYSIFTLDEQDKLHRLDYHIKKVYYNFLFSIKNKTTTTYFYFNKKIVVKNEFKAFSEVAKTYSYFNKKIGGHFTKNITEDLVDELKEYDDFQGSRKEHFLYNMLSYPNNNDFLLKYSLKENKINKIKRTLSKENLFYTIKDNYFKNEKELNDFLEIEEINYSI